MTTHLTSSANIAKRDARASGATGLGSPVSSSRTIPYFTPRPTKWTSCGLNLRSSWLRSAGRVAKHLRTMKGVFARSKPCWISRSRRSASIPRGLAARTKIRVGSRCTMTSVRYHVNDYGRNTIAGALQRKSTNSSGLTAYGYKGKCGQASLTAATAPPRRARRQSGGLRLAPPVPARPVPRRTPSWRCSGAWQVSCGRVASIPSRPYQ
jgi:hypothetical protein